MHVALVKFIAQGMSNIEPAIVEIARYPGCEMNSFLSYVAVCITGCEVHQAVIADVVHLPVELQVSYAEIQAQHALKHI